MAQQYLHGSSEKERMRLLHQAKLIAHRIYRNIVIPAKSKVLEVGSGNGAQTELLLEKYPQIRLTCIDSNAEQIADAQKRFELKHKDIQLIAADLMDHRPKEQYDLIFFCWTLEHISEPLKALQHCFRLLKPGGSIILNEVFNHSFYINPTTQEIDNYWKAFNLLQTKSGGDPNIGVKLGRLLNLSGYQNIKLLSDGFHTSSEQAAVTKDMILYWRDLLMSAAELLIQSNAIKEDLPDKIFQQMSQIADDPKAIFFYQFIQAHAEKPL
ncbi:MAG: methyltransferase [Cyclobacteriaceae bacterium]|nr:methyltransferase [Cyclobacteriaceae bacterium]MCH8516786.1 methyltransferase [Cyclobacteriaceae bacterium]